MKTFPLVCRFWLCAYHHISFINMSCSYVDHYLRFIFLEKEQRCLFRMDDSKQSIPIMSSCCCSMIAMISHQNHPNLSEPLIFPYHHLCRVLFVFEGLPVRARIIQLRSRLPPSVDETETILVFQRSSPMKMMF